MKIDVHGILHTPQETLSFELEEAVEPQDYGYGEYVLPRPVICRGEVKDNHDGSLALIGGYSAEAQLICSRCGKEFSLPLKGDFAARFSSQPGEGWDGESNTFPIVNDKIDLAEVIAGEIYFSLPMQPLCREDCRGLCPVCGVDLNEQSCSCGRDIIDPRWEKLKNLRFDNDQAVDRSTAPEKGVLKNGRTQGKNFQGQ